MAAGALCCAFRKLTVCGQKWIRYVTSTAQPTLPICLVYPARLIPLQPIPLCLLTKFGSNLMLQGWNTYRQRERKTGCDSHLAIIKANALPLTFSPFLNAMKCHYRNRLGFTLIEVVAVLILTSLVSVFGAMLLTTFTGVFIGNKEAAEDSQKIQIAMNRLVKELTFAGAGTLIVSNSQSVQWTSHHPDRFGETQTASWDGTSGGTLTLQGAVLLDNIAAFSISSPNSTEITITLQSTRSNGAAHTTTVHPRYDPL